VPRRVSSCGHAGSIFSTRPSGQALLQPTSERGQSVLHRFHTTRPVSQGHPGADACQAVEQHIGADGHEHDLAHQALWLDERDKKKSDGRKILHLHVEVVASRVEMFQERVLAETAVLLEGEQLVRLRYLAKNRVWNAVRLCGRSDYIGLQKKDLLLPAGHGP